MEDMHSHTEGAGVHYLKKPAPLNKIVRCYIEAKTPKFAKTPTFELWDGVPPRHVKFARCVDDGVAVRVKVKFLLAGRRRRRLTSTEHIISSDPNLSKGIVVGKLESNFLNTKFTIYDSQSPHIGAVPANKTTSGSHIRSSKVSPGGHATRFKAVAYVNYEVGRGMPDHMECSLLTIPASVLDRNGFAPTPLDFLTTALNEDDSTPSHGLGGSAKLKSSAKGPLWDGEKWVTVLDFRTTALNKDDSTPSLGLGGSSKLKSSPKSPLWDGEKWVTVLDFRTTALNEDDSTPSIGLGGSSKLKSSQEDSGAAGFHSRSSALMRRDGLLVLNTKIARWDGKKWVRTVACFPPYPVASGLPISQNFMPKQTSLKSSWNFQVVVASSKEPNQTEEVLLQIKMCGENLYTMDYLYPLSAFQAFAIRLSYFDDKALARRWFG